jgi:predicted metalloprotease with PDZ domain
MLSIKQATIALSTLAAFALAADAQQTQAPAPVSTPPGWTTTTTTSGPPSSPGLNTDTNSQPDSTATGGHATTDVRIRPGIGRLASAMANFSVRTGIEIRPNTNAQVAVRSVRPETPAARAGIEAGDIISRVDGLEVPTITSFQQLLTRQPSQPAFLLTLQRGDQSFRVPLGRQLTLLGMTVFPDPADRPVVTAIDPKSPAGYAGFQVGDMITGLDRQSIARMTALLDFGIPFVRDLRVGQGIPFEIVRGGRHMNLSVTRPSDAELPLLTPEQERRLGRLANGDFRPRQERPVGLKTTTTTTTTPRTSPLASP